MGQLFSLLGLGPKKVFFSDPIEIDEEAEDEGGEVPVLIEFDATLSEDHGQSVSVVSHPVEDGADITDHIRRLPETLSINAVVSNTPILFLASLNAEGIDGGDPRTRAESAFTFLKDSMAEGKVFSVFTTLRTYKSMTISSLACARDKESGNIVNLSIDMVEVIKAETELTDAPKRKRGKKKKKKDKGKQNASSTDATDASGGMFEDFANSFGGP